MKTYKSIFKIVITNLFLLVSLVSVFAQQDPQISQYMYNPALFNPAYSASKQDLTIFAMYRTQWVGLDGAPKTANLSATSPIGDSGLGMGLHFLNDKIGIMNENMLQIDLSYAIDLNQTYKLAMGIKGTANFLSVDYEKLLIYDPKDPNAQHNINAKFTPNIGAGLMVYSDKSYVGISVPMFLANDRYNDEIVTTMKQRMTFYLVGGHIFELSDSVLFKPAMMVKATEGAPLQLDLTANFLLMDKLTLGAAYRWDASISGLVGFQISDNIMVGYSYDADTNKLAKYNSGTHEIFLKFDIFNKLKRFNAPRFF